MDIERELEKYYKWYESALHLIKHMLLYDRMRLEEIPQSMRVVDSSIYVTAIRAGNSISGERLVKAFKILCNDICSLDKNNNQRKELIRLLSQYLYLNDHKEEECFVNFQNNICSEILHELQRNDENVERNLRQQLNNLGFM